MRMPTNPDVDTAADFGDDGEIEMVVVDNRDPEEVIISRQEEQEKESEVEILSGEVKSLCKRFGFSFEQDKLSECLAMVLDTTLNKMSNSEWRKLPYNLQEKLARYGEAMTSNKLKVTVSGKVRNSGLVSAIRECVQNGILEFKEVRSELEKRNFQAKEDSIRTVLWDEKKRAGIALRRSHTGLLSKVKVLFDYGRGVTTTAEMAAALTKDGVRFVPSTLHSYVQELRKNHGIAAR